MKINELFRKRIGFPMDQPLDFAHLHSILEKTAYSIPFENRAIMKKERNDLTEEFIVQKLLTLKQGGLCYELNTVLFLFLAENGFQVSMMKGRVFNADTMTWSAIGKTHAAIKLTYENRDYLIDTGFGGNLPLAPVPFTGESVETSNGRFRIRSREDDFILEMVVRHKDDDWRTGYAFTPEPVDISSWNELRDQLIDEELSPFNKQLLITQLTKEGNKTLTNKTFTQWANGENKKEEIREENFTRLAKLHFGIV
ncbi:arylamine N-acetyltransferase family protein [Jeotgalibacillus proteolyticus]|uniref:arylamine N-acetyltransferase family protein n=1 Tax=Jeotgalibacillus proteolyticus TaxID=2082395 RepID=UPI003CF157BC